MGLFSWLFGSKHYRYSALDDANKYPSEEPREGYYWKWVEHPMENGLGGWQQVPTTWTAIKERNDRNEARRQSIANGGYSDYLTLRS